MRKQLGRQAGAKGRPESTQQAKEEKAEDALRATSAESSPDVAVAATTTSDRPGAGDGGGPGDTGDHQAGSREVGGNEGVNVPGDNEEGGKESGGGEEPVAPGTSAGGSAGEGADAASSSVDPQEV